jgi:hypothetical protein
MTHRLADTSRLVCNCSEDDWATMQYMLRGTDKNVPRALGVTAFFTLWSLWDCTELAAQSFHSRDHALHIWRIGRPEHG